ncbi:MAG: hypothetical protein CM15mV51_0630 [uncultured marine virus]|nr:MAG: hypothetical protein CM15mV51_0630 [uncultured marine virus]
MNMMIEPDSFIGVSTASQTNRPLEYDLNLTGEFKNLPEVMVVLMIEYIYHLKR